MKPTIGDVFMASRVLYRLAFVLDFCCYDCSFVVTIVLLIFEPLFYFVKLCLFRLSLIE